MTYVIAALPGVAAGTFLLVHLYRHGQEPMGNAGKFFGSFAFVAVLIAGWSVGIAILTANADQLWYVQAFGYVVISAGVATVGAIIGGIANIARDVDDCRE